MNNNNRAQAFHPQRAINQNVPAIPAEEMQYEDYGDTYVKNSYRGKSGGSNNQRDTEGSGSNRVPAQGQGHHKANSMHIIGQLSQKPKNPSLYNKQMSSTQQQQQQNDLLIEEQMKDSFAQKNSHIVMTQQHVKMKQGKNVETNSPMHEKTAGNQIIFQQVPVSLMQPSAQGASHKKANSLMNQKMMQLLLNKDQSNTQTIENTYAGQQANQALKANPGTFHAQTPNIIDSGQPVYHHIKSKSFMNELISATADNSQQASRPIPSTVVKQSKKSQNLIGSSPNMSTSAVPRGPIYNVMQTDGVKKKIKAPSIQQSQLKSKMISNSFDKTSGGPQIMKTQKLGMKQQSFQNKVTKKPGASNIKHPSAGIPTSMPSGFVTGMVSAGLATHGQVSGHQSIMTGSTSNLNQGIEHRVVIAGINASHQRTRSDANYIQSAPGKNFVISSSNHVYPTVQNVATQKPQSKKASNLKAMSNNNQTSIAPGQGATKGLLKYSKQVVASGQRTSQGVSATRQPQQTMGHKKNQYSTIVKSNYKNLVGDILPGQDFALNDSEIDEPKINQAPPLVDLEIFNSSQNKTTEQKYAELKLKYNDLLSKHFALAAQKTEDNRVERKHKQTLDGQYYAGGGNIAWAPIQNFMHSENMSTAHGQPHTTQQTLEPPQIILNQSHGSQTGIPRRGVSMGSKGSSQGIQNQFYDESSNQMVSFVDPEALLHPSTISAQLYSGANSQERSQRQTPRGEDFLINSMPHAQIMSENRNISHKVSTSNLKNHIYQMGLNEQLNSIAGTVVSRAEASQPIASKSINNKHFSDDPNIGQKRMANAQVQRMPNYVASKSNTKNHKRSVSDGGMFNNLGLKSKGIRPPGQVQGTSEITYIQQKIPIKEKSMQNSQKSFENKINEIRQSNGLPRIQQNMVILEEGDDDNGATFLSNNSNNEENIHTEMGQEHSIEFNVNPQQDMQIVLKKQSVRYTNASQLSNESKDVISSERVKEAIKSKRKMANEPVVGYEESEMNQQIRKYKQKRKNGEHGQTHTGQIITNVAPNGETQTYLEIANEKRGVSHRRVKSGASDQIQAKLAPSKVILFKNKNKAAVQTGQVQNQKSLKYLKETQQKPNNQFMMIQEDEPEVLFMQDESLSQDITDTNAFGPCQFSQNNNKKVINVSFNDFNQSMSNEYEDVKDNLNYSRQNSSDLAITNGLSHPQQSSNKNLNNFLEALSKIKPQNPIVSSSPKKGQHKKMKSEITVPNELQHDVKISSQSGNTNQLRLEKYQKMMQKVKQNDKMKRDSVGSSDYKSKIKTMSPTQKQSQREEPGISRGQPISGQSSGNDLKITFIGDQALLQKQQKTKGIKATAAVQSLNCERVQFNQIKAKYSGISTSGVNSNTGGQPSPIISSKRVPQKIIVQVQSGDEQSPLPLEPRNLEVQQNNFIKNNDNSRQRVTPGGEASMDEPSKFKAKGQPSQGQKKKIKRSQGEIPNVQEVDAQFLIQNLNKFDRMEEQKRIHIIQHPVPSGFKVLNQVNPQPSPHAPQVSERLVTDESGNTGLTPRSKNIRKLIKLIKLGFRQNPPIPPETTIDFYRIGKILGKGAFGKVNLAIHKLTQCVCAIKSINKQFFSDESQTKKVMQEVVMLKKTRHQNIVRLYEYFETEKHILFVIELCAGGDLLNYVRRRRRLKEDVAKCLFKQIIESLAYCHSKSILHRDIKLDNILLDANGQVKLCDFGVGKIVKKGEKMTEQCGTPAYIAPEILRDKGYYGFKVDIWSAGVVLYAMLYGTVPFKSSNMTGLQEIITKAKYSLKDDISQEARDMLKGLLEKDPNKRFSISQILNHPWLSDAVGPSEIQLFTEQERQYIKSEFSYGKSMRYNRNRDGFSVSHQSDPVGMSSNPGSLHEPVNSDLEKDMFTEHMLDTTQNSILKNCETKSVILAPFNSTKSNLQEGDNHPAVELSDSIKELLESRRIIKYGPRVRDIDKQYEINNNADLDNGVYHKMDDEQQDEQLEEPQEENVESELNYNEQDEVDYDPEEREILQQLKKQGKKVANKQSDLQKLENMIHDQEERERESTPGGFNPQISENLLQNSLQSDMSPERNNRGVMMIIEGNHPTEESYISSRSERLFYQTLAQNEILIIDESLVGIVQELGYPREYLNKCLNQAELNYATTSYWLLHFTKRMHELGEKWDKLRQEKEHTEQITNGPGLILTFKEVPE